MTSRKNNRHNKNHRRSRIPMHTLLCGGILCCAAPALAQDAGDAGQPRGIVAINQSTFLSGAGFTSIQAAVDAAQNGDVIQLISGTINESGIVIDRPLTIQGLGMDATIVDGGQLDRVFSVVFNDANNGHPGFGIGAVPIVFEHLTIRNGLTTGNGGGISLSANTSAVLLDRVRFEGNQASSGGAFADSASPFVTGRVREFRDCEFLSNAATGAGGINGGGACYFGDLAINYRIVNSFFQGNTAMNTGAALSTGQSTLPQVLLANCTLVEHPLNGAGSDALIAAGGTGPELDVFNCVFADNAADRIALQPGGTGAVRYSVLGSGTTLQGVSSAGNTTVDPTFVDAANGDYRLAAGSSGIDMGDTMAYLAAGGGAGDLNGAVRVLNDPLVTDTGPAGSCIDAGAYEHQTPDTDSSCPGDINGDGVIDTADLGILIGAFGTSCP